MRKENIKFAFIIQLSFCGICYADNWSINDKTELPPEADENRIIKWCDDVTGENIRYASANIKISGYHPCGSIISNETCDGENNKILGNPKSGIFKSCEKVSKNETVVDTTEEKKGLSSKELKELKSAMKKAAEKQNADPEVQLQILADNLMKSFFGNINNGNGEKDLSKLINIKDSRKMMEEIQSKLEKSLPTLDEDTRKLVEPLLKNLKKVKY